MAVNYHTPTIRPDDFVMGQVVTMKSPKVSPQQKFVVCSTNAKTVTVAVLGGANGRYWRVTPRLLIPSDAK